MSTVVGRSGAPRGHLRLGLFALCGLVFLGFSIPAFAELTTHWTGIVLGDYIYAGHELHHFVLGATLPLLLLGVIVQAIHPTRRVAALYSSLYIWVMVVLVFSIGGEFSGVLLVLFLALAGMVFFHPLENEHRPSFDSVGRLAVAVASVTAVVGVVLAGLELHAHVTAINGHVAFNHYLFMAVTWLSIGGLALIGSLKPRGWRFATYGSAFLLVVIGGASIAYPGVEQGSSLGIWLGAVAILWAFVLVLAAERGEAILDRLR